MPKFCLIGKSLKHTLSPEIHKEFGFSYGVQELADIDSLRSFMRGKDFDSINVTIPYKTDVMEFLDEIDDTALDAGAVNTVVNAGGKLIGFNTDVGGMEYALRRADIDIKGKAVLILGSGGTAKTAAYMAKHGGAKSVKTVSRTGDINYQNCYLRANTEVIIDTTPVGMFPNAYGCALDISKFPNLKGVFDAVYNPLETLIVKECKKLGIAAANGLYMLVEQARIAHNLFAKFTGFGDVVGECETERVVKKIRADRQDITFIGMAGCGKTTVANAVALALGREAVDTDREIEKQTGKSIPELFGEVGEQGFREIEKEAVARVCSTLGKVIATGGGAVSDAQNRFFISSNSRVIWLKRDISMLETMGRPLSKTAAEVERLYMLRKEIYADMADIIVENNGDVKDTTYEILQKITEM